MVNNDRVRIVRSFRIDKKLLRDVDDYCENHNVDRTTLINNLLQEWVNSYKKEKVK